ncbi:hypothetical protein E2C01_042220 [Portunus trituberculatus]|uniref:Uncharacterized protein n=1 Tax=Portunus trituberculatus TaxID=210409 RepID=A0A5B7FSU3_PORTR|nr:hypothetical protein [Portunus trituberculatus]
MLLARMLCKTNKMHNKSLARIYNRTARATHPHTRRDCEAPGMGINCKNGNSGELLQQVDCEHGTHYTVTLACPATPAQATPQTTDPRLLISPPHGALCLTPGAPVDYQ